MKTFTPALVRFIKEEDGAQVVEYALIIAVVSIGLVSAFGSNSTLSTKFSELVASIGTCLTPGKC